MKNKGLIAIIVMLVIALGVVSMLYFNEKTNSTTKNNYMEEMNKKYPDGIGELVILEYGIKGVDNEEDDISLHAVDAVYYYTGSNMGKLIIGGEEIKINSIIKDMCVTYNYNEMQSVNYGNEVKNECVSILYILFEDGTIGKITTDDIRNENYNITIMQEYGNVDYFIETQPIEHGGEDLLWAVTKDGKASIVDVLSAGD